VGAALFDGKAIMALNLGPDSNPEQEIRDNYEAIVADEIRNVSFDDIAKHADEMDDSSLAAWARKRAAEQGKNTTPRSAKSPPKAVRSE
jgi:hypothetical protein